MKNLLFLLGFLVLPGCSQASLEQFQSTEEIVALFNESYTREAVNNLGLRLADTSEQTNRDRIAINQRTRYNETRTTGTITTYYGAAFVDLTTRELNPDRTNHRMVAETGILEVGNRMPRHMRGELDNIRFHFGADEEDLTNERLVRLDLHRAQYLDGMDLTQFTMFHQGNPVQTLVDILEILHKNYGLQGWINSDSLGRYIGFVRDNVHFRMRQFSSSEVIGGARITATLLD